MIPRNAIGCEQRCGACGFGCRYGAKQSTLKTYLQDAHDHRARIIVRCSADKVLIENGRAVGVKATVTDAGTGKTYYDRRHLLHGLRQAARVHFAAGARSVISLHSKRTRLDWREDGTVNDPGLREFDRQLECHGMGPNRIMMFTAHQMGTCRMGADPKTSVTNEHGEVHGVKGLFVCDGSLFPAASGVNPMLSIMGLAHKASQYIKTVG